MRLISGLIAVWVVCSFVFAEAGKPNETFWELLDKRDFKVSVSPWPAKAGGELKIHGVAEETEDGKFVGTVECRVVAEEKSNAPWVAMTKVKDEKDVEFEKTVKLPDAGKVFVQFRITQKDARKPLELTDWSVALEK